LIKERERYNRRSKRKNEKEGENLCKSSPAEPYTEKEEPRSIQILTIQGKKNRGGSSVGAVEECTIFQHALVGVTVTKKNHDDKWI
jgi:hypothetical protein